MGQKDITEKVLEDYNDVFADIINGLLFDGVQEIKPEALENTTVHAQYKAEDDKVHELERDIAKYWKDEKVELAICGIENQSIVEKNMPFRIIGYDGSAYRNQLQQERRKMLPVVTIVLYFGTDRHWNSRKKNFSRHSRCSHMRYVTPSLLSQVSYRCYPTIIRNFVWMNTGTTLWKI